MRAVNSHAGVAAAVLAAAMGVARAPGQPAKADNQPPSTEPAPRPAPAAPPTALEALAQKPVRRIVFNGLTKTTPETVWNVIRTREGQPLDPETVRQDVERLKRLGKFGEIAARARTFDDGSVEVTFDFKEAEIIYAVDIVGNRQIANADIQPLVSHLEKTSVDDFELGAARAAIERMYRDKGYYQATVSVDREELKRGTVLFRVAEGERVRVTDIRFEGNNSFAPRQLTPNIKTTTAGLFETGPVDPEQLDRDVDSIREFYKDRGYLDVRADRQVTFSPNGKEAIVTFIIDEGSVYTLRKVKVETLTPAGQRNPQAPGVFSEAQIAGLMEIKAGDVYSAAKVRRSLDIVRNAYAREGYVEYAARDHELREPGTQFVDLLLLVHEGRRYRTGLITVKGDSLTQQKVIQREITDIRPDRPLDWSGEREGGGSDRMVTDAEKRLTDLNIFEPGSIKLTLQPPDPSDPEHRDVLIEVKEWNTGSLSFGVAAGSDSGLSGILSLKQRNFDLADWPDSVGEFFSGRAFRGAGQNFEITLSPGTTVQNYSVSLSDPYLFDTDYQGAAAGRYYKRLLDQNDEARTGGSLAVGRHFGERWTGNVTLRFDQVEITNIDADAPADIFAVQGGSQVSAIGVNFTRTTVDSRLRPTRGTRLSAGVERVGGLGGDFNFTALSLDYQFFLPLYESFLGYKTVLNWRVDAKYIPEGAGKAPFYERLYLGGRSFRGFKYRTVSPKGFQLNGTPTNDPIGGSWSFFTGLEVQQPIYQDVVALAVFVDSGTVTNRIGFSQYRVSAGAGIRVAVRQLSPVPLAFDFAIPLRKEEGDSRRIFSFSIDLPF